jgi:hypothetical protein
MSSGDVVAIHAALVATADADGEVILFGGDNHYFDGQQNKEIHHTARFNCRTHVLATVTSPPADVYCCGHAFLSDGRLLTAGGTTSFPPDSAPPHDHKHFGGDRQASVYNSRTQSFIEASSIPTR